MSRTKSLAAFGAALLTTASPAALAQAADEDEDEVETILVTGVPTPIDQVGRSVSVISADDIAIRQQRFLLDTLNYAPGVQIIDSGSVGSLASVSIRGLPSQQTVVVLDGVVQNNPATFGGSFNFANFDVSDVARIEILRGSQSTLYGADAIGGVINILTKDGSDGFGAQGFVEAGSFGTLRGSAEVRGGTDVVSGRFTATSVTTFGFSTALLDANGGPATEDDGFRNITLSGKAQAKPTDNLRFDATVRYSDSRFDFDGFSSTTFQPGDADNVGVTDELTAAGSATLDLFDDRLEQRLTIAFSRIDQLNDESGIRTFDAVGDRLSFEYRGTVSPIDMVTVVYGAEYEEQTADIPIGFGTSGSNDVISGYGVFQLRPIDRITLNAGVRHTSNDGLDVAENANTSFSGSAAFRLPIIETTLRGGYNESFRAPSLSELGLNPDLESESGAGWEIGLERTFLQGRVQASATYFDQAITNLVAFPPPFFGPENVERFESRGVEFAARARPIDTLDVAISYTFTDAENASTGVVAGLIPNHRASFDVDWRPIDRLRVGGGLFFNGNEELFGQQVDNFVLINLRAAFDVTERFEVFARIENATDADYVDNPGFATAPISAFGGIRAKL